jgi:hypothetical protein
MFTVTNLYNTQVTDIGPKLYEIIGTTTIKQKFMLNFYL